LTVVGSTNDLKPANLMLLSRIEPTYSSDKDKQQSIQRSLADMHSKLTCKIKLG